ncbi:MAG: hypothetical protein ACW99G_01730 [Candidatus Thorarchaeota archaeon]|jgi:hypothetical protein
MTEAEVKVENDESTETMNSEEMEEKFVTRRECVLKEETVNGVKEAVDDIQDDITVIKESLASIATWMELHNKTHDSNPGGWKKAQTLAVVASVCVASLSLLSSSVIGIITVIHLTGSP